MSEQSQLTHTRVLPCLPIHCLRLVSLGGRGKVWRRRGKLQAVLCVPSSITAPHRHTSMSGSSSISSGVTFESVLPHAKLDAFADAHGRTLLLRGLNVSGDAKYPVSHALAGTPEFYDVSRVSYAGKPFADAREAEQWWARLRAWGIGVVRLVVCWEALEPREMGVYDDEYLAYVRMLVRTADEAGLSVFIDGHQDVVCTRHPSHGRGIFADDCGTERVVVAV